MTTNQLSYRELQVLRLIADGRTTDSIATRLSLSRGTVGNHRESLYRRLGARSEAHAVALGFRSGLLPITGERA